jgi:hypothetical protein
MIPIPAAKPGATHHHSRDMTAIQRFAAEADAALKPYGIRVQTWGNSRTKLHVFTERFGAEVKFKDQVENMIQVRQQYG